MAGLAIARCDGTLFDTNSIQEEDIVELCVEVGQAHPKSVLWLLVMELVIVFQSSKEMWHVLSPRPLPDVMNL